MNQLMEIISFLLWLICFVNEIIYILKNNKEPLFKDFKNKILQVIRFDRLLLIIIFIIYAHFKKDFLTIIIFSVICLYLYINKLYEKSKKEKLGNVIKRNWLVIILVLLWVSIPMAYYILTSDYMNACIWLLLYIIFSYIIVGISKFVSDFIIKSINKN